MNKRLKKISKLLSDSYDFNTLSGIFGKLKKDVRENREFFEGLNAIDIIYIVYYIFSFKKYGNFEWADNIIPELYITHSFMFEEGNFSHDTCDDCEGSGHIDCDWCEGSGTLRCTECNGDGQVECETCDGEGSVEMEDGEYETCDDCIGRGYNKCDMCGGTGEESCNRCNGDGQEQCDNCDGDGQVETTKVLYNIYLFIVPSSKFLKKFYFSLENKEPMSSSPEQIEAIPEVLDLGRNWKDLDAEFEEDISGDELYCYDIKPLNSEKGKLKMSVNKFDVYIVPLSQPLDFFA